MPAVAGPPPTMPPAPPGPPMLGPPQPRPAPAPVGPSPTLLGRPPVAPPLDDSVTTAVHPPLPAEEEFDAFGGYPRPNPGLRVPLVGAPPSEGITEEFAQVLDGLAPPSMPLDSTQAHSGPYVDDDFDDDLSDLRQDRGGSDRGDDLDRYEFADNDYDSREDLDGRRAFDDRDELDDRDDLDDLEAATGREWFAMGAQVGVGAIAGAAVWLAFSWLWGMLPAIAVIAALLVIVGLVLAVRRLRRADDLQTTVLAILAGLVVTASPAALLLLRR